MHRSRRRRGRASEVLLALLAFVFSLIGPAAAVATALTTTTIESSLNPAYPDEAVVLDIHVDPAPPEPGTVEIWDTFDPIGSARAILSMPAGSGHVTYTGAAGSFLSVEGTHDLTAIFKGTTSSAASTSDTLEQIIRRDDTTTTIDVDPPEVGPRGVVHVAVHVSPTPSPAGIVVITLQKGDFTGLQTHAPTDTNGDGSVDIDTTNWPTGTYDATARFQATDRLHASTSDPTSVTVTAPNDPPPPKPDARDLDGATESSCALDANGHLACWGRGARNELQIPSGTFRSVSLPCAVRMTGEAVCWAYGSGPSPQPPDGTYLEVVGGGPATCGIRVDHTIACWGDPEEVQFFAGPGGTFEHVSVGSGHACAIRSDGSVACWGAGPAGVSPPGTFTSVSAGGGYSCGLRPSGSIECWGINFYGANVPPAGQFTAVRAGLTSACGLSSSADLVCWGDTTFGPPTFVAGPFTQIDVGGDGACARRPDDSITCWGAVQYPYWHIEGAIVSPVPPAQAFVGHPYSHVFLANEAPTPMFSIVEGELPPGLDLAPDGTLGGTPTTAGTWSGLVVRGTNGIAPVVEQAFSITVTLDLTAPTSTAPIPLGAPSGSTLLGGLVPIRAAWTGSDVGSGIDHYLLWLSKDGGGWTSLSTSLTSSSYLSRLASGHTYRFAVRPVDRAGNVGAVRAGSTFRLTAIQQTTSAVHYRGTWATSTSTMWWGGTAKSSSTKGSTATYTYTGKSIAWVGLKGYNRGKAQVYVNGVLKATVDLYSGTTLRQRIIWSANYTTSATRTITIKVLGTSGRPRVDVDGFIVGS